MGVAGRESLGKPAEPTLRQSKTALLEAAQAAVAEQRTKGPRRGTWSGASAARRAAQSMISGLIVAGAFLLLIQPAWLSGPRLPAETPEIRSASATLVLVEAASRI